MVIYSNTKLSMPIFGKVTQPTMWQERSWRLSARVSALPWHIWSVYLTPFTEASTDVSKIESTMSNMQNKFVDMFNDLQRERDKQIAEENRRWKEKRAEEEALRSISVHLLLFSSWANQQ